MNEILRHICTFSELQFNIAYASPVTTYYECLYYDHSGTLGPRVTQHATEDRLVV